jgi:hypothetical protein
VLFAEAKLWRSYDEPPEPGDGVAEVLIQFCRRLSEPENHGESLLRFATRDPAVSLDEFAIAAGVKGGNTPTVPTWHWSRIVTRSYNACGCSIEEGMSTMTRLILTIDDSAAEKARLVAQRRRITLDALVQGLIEGLDMEDQDAGRRACEALDESFRLVSAPLGGKPWKERDELYDR